MISSRLLLTGAAPSFPPRPRAGLWRGPTLVSRPSSRRSGRGRHTVLHSAAPSRLLPGRPSGSGLQSLPSGPFRACPPPVTPPASEPSLREDVGPARDRPGPHPGKGGPATETPRSTRGRRLGTVNVAGVEPGGRRRRGARKGPDGAEPERRGGARVAAPLKGRS